MSTKETLNFKDTPTINHKDFLEDNNDESKRSSSSEKELSNKNTDDKDEFSNGTHSDNHQKNKEDMDEDTAEETRDYEEKYSDEGFWDKVTRYAKKAGESALSPALKLYYSADDPDTPTWAKTTIYGALGYFISPIDAIPDVTPMLGYTDDIGVLAGAIGVVAAHIKDEHTEKAKETLKRWFS